MEMDAPCPTLKESHHDALNYTWLSDRIACQHQALGRLVATEKSDTMCLHPDNLGPQEGVAPEEGSDLLDLMQ